MPDTVTLRDTEGRVYGVPAERVASYLAQGFQPESDVEAIARQTADVFHQEHGGIGGTLAAGGIGALSGLTLGLSDQALGALGAGRTVSHLEAEHPYATGIGTFAGAIAPAVLTGGAAVGEEAAGLGAKILAHSPAGLVSRAGSAVSELGEGAGLAGRLAAGTAGAATEGAFYGGGQYLTESALEDKPLSAESFVAGMGHGALFAAPIGAAGVLASSTLQKVRSLFPRSEVSAAAASGVKSQASSALAQALRDGDQMATAAERKLADVDAGLRVAEAGENSTRRAFGGADPQALADQVTGSVDRKQVAEALDAYRQARGEFASWAADEGGDLEHMLTGLEPVDLFGRHVPVGEFGAPGARGIKTPGEIERAAVEAGGQGEAVATSQAGDATGAGGPRAMRGTQPGPAEVPPGFHPALPSDGGNVFDRAPTIHAGVPAPASLSRETFREHGYVVRPSALADHNVRGIPSGDAANLAERVGKVHSAWEAGKAVPAIEIDVDKAGRYFVADGNHRVLAAAADGDRPLLARFRPIESSMEREPVIANDIRHRLTGPVGGDLESALRGTRDQLAAGGELPAIGRESIDAYRGAQQAKSASAAEHFRAQALAARAERAGLGDAAAPWNEGIPREMVDGGGYQGSVMAADERAMQQAQAGRGSTSAEPDALAARILRNAEAAGNPTIEGASARELARNPAMVTPPVDPMVALTPEEIAAQRGRFRAIASNQGVAKAILRRGAQAADVGPDIARGAKVIGDLESSSAKLTDALGSESPGTATQHAAGYHAAVGEAQGRATASSAKAAADLTAKVPGVAGPGAGGWLADVGSALEVLRAVGAHVPAVSAIPVIGPILGLWLKARAVLGIMGRKGGGIGRSTEGLIAGTAAAARERVVAATSSLLSGGAKIAAKAPRAAGPAVLLAGSLFPGGEDPKDDSPRALFEARSADITRAMTPGAVDQAIGQRYPTSDPALHDAIVAQVQRGITFLDSKRPRETILPGMIPGDGAWHPSLAAMDEFGKYVHAVNDPISVLEDLGRGVASAEGAETLRIVYPQLFAYAQKTLLQASQVMEKTLPYTRRVSISIMYHLPVDGTMQPEHARYLATQTAPSPPPSSPPTSSGPLRLGQATMSPLDQRAAGT